jgi:large subunit ribosomal protein L30
MPRKAKQSHKLQITYVRSAIGDGKDQKGTVRALGLKRIGDTVQQEDTAVIRGMVNKVRHLVQVTEVTA